MDLTLYEEITLLALHDKDGRLRGDHPRHRIAGAVLAGLILRGAVVLDNEKKTLKPLDAGTQLQDERLKAAWLMIDERPDGYDIGDLVGKLSSEKSLVDDIAEGLCSKGILKSEPQKILWFFEVNTYPESDPSIEREIIDRMRLVITGAKPADERTLALIALAGTYGLININLGNDFANKYKGRIDDIVKGNEIGQTTKELLEAIDLMLVMAVIIPTMITVTT